ncbi:prolipoprotein diacylglyceryl transferase family protein [Longirhabdus pacifica]|uniref:prolipoprotein diacylglyceryl transferase family protein n=1 Tax=Longirhabdus pacifica TaxID=2305227 RepID=UPI001F0C3914|nr:prolipoprotein diacylglyceryl transferase family protein [Longirhabdus pacifica]
MEGKTIVGGLLGGLIGVEISKRFVGVKQSTGDDMVIPIVIGMCIGRVGCFLTGLSDRTYGTATTWMTGVNFGDGIMRHPTQLYEIAALLCFMLLLGYVHYIEKKRGSVFHQGFRFQLFMLYYLTFRLFIEWIKPTPHPYFGLSNIQLAACIGIVYYIWLVRRKMKKMNTIKTITAT